MALVPNQIRGLAQPLQADRWEVIFPSIPGTGSTTDLSLRARSVSMPGYDANVVESWFKGTRVKYNTKTMDKGNVTISFEESISLSVYETFRVWRTFLDTRNPALYKTVMVLKIMDVAETTKATFTFGGVFPTDLPDVGLDYSNDGLINIDISFSYDWFEKV